MSDRYWHRYFDNLPKCCRRRPSWEPANSRIAQRWRQLSNDRGAKHAASGHEFTLYCFATPRRRDG